MSKLPVYKSWDEVPEGLATKTQLKQMGRKPAKGQEPVAQKRSRYPRTANYDLYEIDKAVERKPASPAQLAALEKARRQAKINERCHLCNTPFRYMDRSPVPRSDPPAGESAYVCRFCVDKKRSSKWAAEFLANPKAVILDSETAGLDDDDQIVEIAIIDPLGNVLLDTLVKPLGPIPAAATAIHGITDEMVAEAHTFAQLLPRIEAIIEDRSVAIYNAAFDFRLLRQSAQAWGLESQTEAGYYCVMEAYAEWFGDWSSYFRSYTYQPLNGGHRALGDCQATLALLREMAGLPGSLSSDRERQ